MNFVYVCRPGENEELRYSIRSVISSFPDATIWVVGAKPKWYGGNFIEVKKERNKYATVDKNLQAIVDSELIAESFILMNDDFFITHKIDKIEVYHSGPMIDMINRVDALCRVHNLDRSYLNRVQRTYNFIKGRYRDKEPINYELHMPMPMEKSKLAPLIGKPALWRSAYGNMYDIGGIFSGDVKIYNSGMYQSFDYRNANGPYLSTDDDAFESAKDYLHNLFPNPSKYELDMQ